MSKLITAYAESAGRIADLEVSLKAQTWATEVALDLLEAEKTKSTESDWMLVKIVADLPHSTDDIIALLVKHGVIVEVEVKEEEVVA